MAQPVNIPKLKSEELAENLKAVMSRDFKSPELKPILMGFLIKAKNQQESLEGEMDRDLKPEKWRERILKYQNINRYSPKMKKLKEILQTKNLP